ncbi:ATP-dependent helicase HrpB [Corynebacterium sphenisci]|uniref:ATP-dependent helicase HrpB n=1 Tax=Corynebacterium sphenisci TaxID=191493 RepID=UPI0026E0ABA4|nr:ATP-dependent helicase HrpB [Corynebacterium sphenisci]MDO5731004.1 ATP-dependent helicase HrpB [Corynebacterium sphenisci]
MDQPRTPLDPARVARGLPIAAALGPLAEALGRAPGAAAVVQAPPGTGKTTAVPPAVAAAVAGHGAAGRVLVTAPRRVAVRAAARRLADLAGVRLGGPVGYAVRGDVRTGPDTVVEFATPGVLLRRLLADPELPGVAAVVLDEVHERDLDTDLALAMLRDLRDLREDLMLVAMSATVDAERFAALLDVDGAPAPVVAAAATAHPLEIRYRPHTGPRLGPRGVERGFLDHAAAQAAALAAEAAGDVLVFLPGVREIDHVRARLAALAPEAETLPLHGRLDAAEQDRVVAGRDRRGRRIIVATAVAESSITVPGVRAVVDACLDRGPRLDLARGMSGLVTVSCARSSAEQRAGRAARLGPGIAVRLLAEAEWPQLDAWPAPQIAVAELTRAMLDLAVWGTPGGAGLRLPDPPPAAHAAAANATLAALGAVDAAGQATGLGRLLARLPVHPATGRALLTAAGPLGARRAAAAAALLAEAPAGDLTRARPDGTARREARRLERLLDRRDVAAAAGDLARAAGEPPDADPVALVTALARPERIARRRHPDSAEYLTVGGTAATAPAELRGHEWLAIAEVTRAPGAAGGRAGALIRAAAPGNRELAGYAAAARRGTAREVRLTGPLGAGRVSAREVDRLGAIELAARPVPPTAAECAAALTGALAADPALLRCTPAAEALRARLALLHRELGDPWPAVDRASLAARAGELLAGRGAETAPAAVTAEELRRLLPWPAAGRLGELVPERIRVPSGSRVRLDYPDPDQPADAARDAQPVLAVKLQECFGLAETPRILDGRVPVLLHLLSPAGRPLAVTADLRSFWDGPYAAVRAEMRGRYPRHPWPEDPWTAPATARTTRRSR